MKTFHLTTTLLVAVIFCAVTLAYDEDSDSAERYQRKASLRRALRPAPRDNKGCDVLIGSCGKNGKCCDIHDDCYKKHNCDSSSWLHLWGDCHQCNVDVMACVVRLNPGASSCCKEGNCGDPQTLRSLIG